MSPQVDSVTSPVTFPFENGVIDPVSGCHTIVCSDKSIALGIWAASKPLFDHQGADPCQRSDFKRDK